MKELSIDGDAAVSCHGEVGDVLEVFVDISSTSKLSTKSELDGVLISIWHADLLQVTRKSFRLAVSIFVNEIRFSLLEVRKCKEQECGRSHHLQ